MYIDDEAGPVRAGGWGYLLGDEGAAFWIGRESIRWVRVDFCQPTCWFDVSE
jgi:N-acetylglucosamine kinase-like BadF-type ATPase